MEITETKHVATLELQPHETAETLDRELAEFYGMLFTFDNTQERAIIERDGKRYASVGFISTEYANEYLRHRANSSIGGSELPREL